VVGLSISWIALSSCTPLTPLPPRERRYGEPVAAPATPDAEYFAAHPLMVPVVGVSPGEVDDSFNAPRSDGRTHRATDIRAARGTPVVAAADGRVIMMRENALGGITVYLVDRAQRFVYYYAHLERYAERLAEGMDVQQGRLLGYVGTSGNAPPNFPHLHFQALRLDRSRRDWWNGPPVDVRPYFTLTGRERTQ
jgi:murein DD-endopeptidase MepM/ murein hydrolase activator NlpD